MSRMSNGASGRSMEAEAVLDFWFGDPADPGNIERHGKLWFSSTKAQDRTMRERFGGLHDRAGGGELDSWLATPRGTLALILLLDQFTRNLYRGTASAFGNDARALALARNGIERKLDSSLHVPERAFFYMPFQHSENPADQRRSVDLFEALVEASPAPFQSYAKNTLEYAVLHRDIVERFGRFPHRNDLLGRQSTEEEKEYLEQGGHRFGQG